MKKLSDLSNQTSLSICSVCIILGSLLGDMSIYINKSSGNPMIYLKHSLIQKDYFLWKLNYLKNLNNTFDQDLINVTCNNKFKCASIEDKKLLVIYNLVNRKNVKVNRKWLNLLDSLALAVWWCDIGLLINSGRQAIFCTDAYNEIEINIICKYINNVLKLNTLKYRTGKNCIRISIFPTKNFLEMIAKHIPCKSMIKKFLIKYKDNTIAKRWISYLSVVSDYDFDTINNVYLNSFINKKKI